MEEKKKTVSYHAVYITVQNMVGESGIDFNNHCI